MGPLGSETSAYFNALGTPSPTWEPASVLREGDLKPAEHGGGQVVEERS